MSKARQFTKDSYNLLVSLLDYYYYKHTSNGNTWDNGQRGNANVKARLDRGLGNLQFMSMFPNTRVRHIGTMESDHCFVLIDPREHLAGKNV